MRTKSELETAVVDCEQQEQAVRDALEDLWRSPWVRDAYEEYWQIHS